MPTAHVYGTNTAIADPVKTGYTFNGWKVNGGAAVKNLTLGATDYTNVISLQATWTANKYTVTFDKQNGTGGNTSAAATFNSAMPAITVPTRPGYTFGGYYTEREGGGEQIFDGNLNAVYANNWDKNEEKITLYAYWVPNSETLTAQIQQLKNANAALTSGIDALKSENLSISGSITALSASLETAQNTIDSLGDTYATDGELAAAVAALEKKIEEAKSELNAKINEVQTNLENAVSTLNTSIAAKADSTALSQAIEDLTNAYEAADVVINGNLTMLNVNLASEVSRLEKSYKEADDALAEAIKKVQANLDAAKKQLENKDNELATEIKILQDTTKNLMIALIVIGGVLLSLGVSVVVLFLKRKVKP